MLLEDNPGHKTRGLGELSYISLMRVVKHLKTCELLRSSGVTEGTDYAASKKQSMGRCLHLPPTNAHGNIQSCRESSCTNLGATRSSNRGECVNWFISNYLIM